MELLEKLQLRTMTMKGLVLLYKKRLIKLGLLSLQNAQGNLKVYKYLKEECKECSQALFSGAQNFKTWIIKGSVIML